MDGSPHGTPVPSSGSPQSAGRMWQRDVPARTFLPGEQPLPPQDAARRQKLPDFFILTTKLIQLKPRSARRTEIKSIFIK